MTEKAPVVLSEDERNFKIIWDNVFRLSTLDTQVMLSLSNKAAHFAQWSPLEYLEVYLSCYGTTELPNLATLLERHNATVKNLTLRVCEKYSKEPLENVAQGLLSRIASKIEVLDILFRYPWSNEKGVSIYQKIFANVKDLPMVHTINLHVDTICAVAIAKFLLPKAPNVKSLSAITAYNSWSTGDPKGLTSHLLRELLPSLTQLKDLSILIPKDFQDWSALTALTSVKSLNMALCEPVLGSQSLKVSNEADIEPIVAAALKIVPPKVGANFIISYYHMGRSDQNGLFIGSPMQAALKCGCSLSYLQSLESRGVDLSNETLCKAVALSAAKLGRQDVFEWAIRLGNINLLNDGGVLLRLLLCQAADNCFDLVFKHQLAADLEHGYLKQLFHEDEEFYCDDIFEILSDSRLEWILQRQDKLGLDFVNVRPVTPFEKLSNVMGHAMFNSLNRWERVPSTVKLILKYVEPAKLFAPPAVDPNLPPQEIQYTKYGDIIPSDDRRPESPMATWAMSHYDICQMISEGPTQPWENAQWRFLEFMFENYMEQILQVDRSSLEFHRELMKNRGRTDLLEKLDRFVSENPLSS